MGITTSDGQYFEDMFDYQTAFAGKVTDPIPDTSKFKQQASQTPTKDLNSPAASTARPGGILGDIMSVRIDDIPEGVSARDYLKQLQKETADQYKKGRRSEIMSDEDPTIIAGQQYAMNEKDNQLQPHLGPEIGAKGGPSNYTGASGNKVTAPNYKEDRLTVAIKTPEGVRVGKPGNIHSDLFTEKDWSGDLRGFEQGYVTQSGQFLNREQALTHVRNTAPTMKSDLLRSKRGLESIDYEDMLK